MLRGFAIGVSTTMASATLATIELTATDVLSLCPYCYQQKHHKDYVQYHRYNRIRIEIGHFNKLRIFKQLKHLGGVIAPFAFHDVINHVTIDGLGAEFQG